MSEQAAVSVPRKARSLDERADKAIESMREVAGTVKHLGDELVEAKRQWASANDEVARLTEQLAEAEAQAAEGGEALAAVDDFRLGLCDRDELLKRVCGRT